MVLLTQREEGMERTAIYDTTTATPMKSRPAFHITNFNKQHFNTLTLPSHLYMHGTILKACSGVFYMFVCVYILNKYDDDDDDNAMMKRHSNVIHLLDTALQLLQHFYCHS